MLPFRDFENEAVAGAREAEYVFLSRIPDRLGGYVYYILFLNIMSGIRLSIRPNGCIEVRPTVFGFRKTASAVGLTDVDSYLHLGNAQLDTCSLTECIVIVR